MKSCLRGALQRSCHHRIAACLQAQVVQLAKAGFHYETVAAAAECVMKEIRTGGCGHFIMRAEKSCNNIRQTAIPYVHQLSHWLKNFTRKCGVNVLFSAAEELVRTYKAVNMKKTPACTIYYQCKYVPCRTGIVYRTPFSYVGSTMSANQHAA